MSGGRVEPTGPGPRVSRLTVRARAGPVLGPLLPNMCSHGETCDWTSGARHALLCRPEPGPLEDPPASSHPAGVMPMAGLGQWQHKLLLTDGGTYGQAHRHPADRA